MKYMHKYTFRRKPIKERLPVQHWGSSKLFFTFNLLREVETSVFLETAENSKRNIKYS